MIRGVLYMSLVLVAIPAKVSLRNHHYISGGGGKDYGKDDVHDISLWIKQNQVKMFSGFSFHIYAIDNGKVSPHLKDPNVNQYLPVIPSELSSVNFTWASGPSKKYTYHFDRLQSLDESILKPPIISIPAMGVVPKTPQEFSVLLPCSDEHSGIALFSIGLLIQSRRSGKPLPGTPLRLTLKKECETRGEMRYPYLDRTMASSQAPDPECDKKCANNGWCNRDKLCKCPEGYMGQYCQTALCYPVCQNGGNCTAPAVCSCPKGYQGRHCEGGICTEKCLNGGKCIQKDKCKCPKGYLGLRCEISKCTIPCQNGGKCIGPNKCRCPPSLSGNHCEIGRRQRSTCRKPCKHGECSNHKCRCFDGFYGKFCARRHKYRRHNKQADQE